MKSPWGCVYVNKIWIRGGEREPSHITEPCVIAWKGEKCKISKDNDDEPPRQFIRFCGSVFDTSHMGNTGIRGFSFDCEGCELTIYSAVEFQGENSVRLCWFFRSCRSFRISVKFWADMYPMSTKISRFCPCMRACVSSSSVLGPRKLNRTSWNSVH